MEVSTLNYFTALKGHCGRAAVVEDYGYLVMFGTLGAATVRIAAPDDAKVGESYWYAISSHIDITGVGSTASAAIADFHAQMGADQ